MRSYADIERDLRHTRQSMLGISAIIALYVGIVVLLVNKPQTPLFWRGYPLAGCMLFLVLLLLGNAFRYTDLLLERFESVPMVTEWECMDLEHDEEEE